jgi:hypothetical protein
MNLYGRIASVPLVGLSILHACTLAAATPPTTDAGVATPTSAAVVTAAEVTSALRGLSPQYTDDEPIRVVDVGAGRIGIFVVGRPKKSDPAMTDDKGAVRVTEGLELAHVSTVLRVLNGAGTIVTGGQLVGAAAMAADDPDAEVIGPGRRGKAILGGESRRVSTGDMVIIPAGVPHGFSEIEGPITYLVIRVDSGKHLPLK